LRSDRPRGDREAAPPPRVFEPGPWRIGEPDRVLQVVAPVRLPADGIVPYHYLFLPFIFREDTWVEAVEIHLATNFQSIVWDHPALPADLRKRAYQWLDENAQGEKKSGDSAEQFYYKARKKAIGPFKQEMWALPAAIRQQISADLEKTFAFLFEQLRVTGTADLVRRFVTAPSLAHGALTHAGALAEDDPDAGE